MPKTRSKKIQRSREKEKEKPLTISQTRDRAKKTIEDLRTKDSKEAKDLLAKLEAALAESDDKVNIDDLNEEMDAMEVDEGEGAGGEEEKGNEAAEQEKEKGNEAAEQEKEKGNEGKGERTDSGTGQDGGDDGNKGSDSDPKIKKESTDNAPLFVPEEKKANEEGEEEEEEEDPEYGRPLFQRHSTKLKDMRTVGWSGGRSKMYINQIGPRNAAIHRLGRLADSAEYEENPPDSEQVSNPYNRYGDKLLTNGKFKYTKRHIHAIYGAAWAGEGLSEDLNQINPDTINGRWPITYVLIAWKIDDKIVKAWEPRQVLRARWGKDFADLAIFKAATEAEERYSEVISGRRRATSRSPSVGLAADAVRQQREMSLGADPPSPRAKSSSPSRARGSTPNRTKSSSPSRAKSSTPTSRVRFTSSKNNFIIDEDLEEVRREFMDGYLECAGVAHFKDLDAISKKDFVVAWQARRDDWLDGQ